MSFYRKERVSKKGIVLGGVGGSHLERLLAGLVTVLVDDVVETRAWQVGVRERVERAPLAVDRHPRILVDAQRRHLVDVAHALHVGGVAASAEDDSDLAEDTVRKGKDVNAIMG